MAEPKVATLCATVIVSFVQAQLSYYMHMASGVAPLTLVRTCNLNATPVICHSPDSPATAELQPPRTRYFSRD